MNRKGMGFFGLPLFTACLAMAPSVGPPGCLASENHHEVTVEVVDGRILYARVHPKTDQQRLWLTYTEPGISLTNSIHWNDVLRVTYKENQYGAAEFQGMATILEHDRQPLPIVLASTSPPPTPRADHVSDMDAVVDGHVVRVRSLMIRAWLENWDADVEPDGFVVHLVPLSKDRKRLPVDGSLRLEVFGQRGPRGRTPRDPLLLGRTSHRVRRGDFVSDDGPYFEVPFTKQHPAFDVNVHAVGLVHAHLSVAGQGTFSASTMVFTRRFNPFRDMLQLQQGTRYLRSERSREHLPSSLSPTPMRTGY